MCDEPAFTVSVETHMRDVCVRECDKHSAACVACCHEKWKYRGMKREDSGAPFSPSPDPHFSYSCEGCKDVFQVYLWMFLLRQKLLCCLLRHYFKKFSRFSRAVTRNLVFKVAFRVWHLPPFSYCLCSSLLVLGIKKEKPFWTKAFSSFLGYSFLPVVFNQLPVLKFLSQFASEWQLQQKYRCVLGGILGYVQYRQ